MKVAPPVAAIANVLLPGAGYVLVGKRVIFGWLLLFASIIGFVQLAVDPLPDVYLYGSTPLSVAFGVVALLSGAAAFGYDAYMLAKEQF